LLFFTIALVLNNLINNFFTEYADVFREEISLLILIWVLNFSLIIGLMISKFKSIQVIYPLMFIMQIRLYSEMCQVYYQLDSLNQVSVEITLRSFAQLYVFAILNMIQCIFIFPNHAKVIFGANILSTFVVVIIEIMRLKF